MSGTVNGLEPVIMLTIGNGYAAGKVRPVFTISTVHNFGVIVVYICCTGFQSNFLPAPLSADITVGIKCQNRIGVIFDRDLDLAADFCNGTEGVSGNNRDNKRSVGIGSRESILGDFFIVNKVSIGIWALSAFDFSINFEGVLAVFISLFILHHTGSEFHRSIRFFIGFRNILCNFPHTGSVGNSIEFTVVENFAINNVGTVDNELFSCDSVIAVTQQSYGSTGTGERYIIDIKDAAAFPVFNTVNIAQLEGEITFDCNRVSIALEINLGSIVQHGVCKGHITNKLIHRNGVFAADCNCTIVGQSTGDDDGAVSRDCHCTVLFDSTGCKGCIININNTICININNTGCGNACTIFHCQSTVRDVEVNALSTCPRLIVDDVGCERSIFTAEDQVAAIADVDKAQCGTFLQVNGHLTIVYNFAVNVDLTAVLIVDSQDGIFGDNSLACIKGEAFCSIECTIEIEDGISSTLELNCAVVVRHHVLFIVPGIGIGCGKVTGDGNFAFHFCFEYQAADIDNNFAFCFHAGNAALQNGNIISCIEEAAVCTACDIQCGCICTCCVVQEAVECIETIAFAIGNNLTDCSTGECGINIDNFSRQGGEDDIAIFAVDDLGIVITGNSDAAGECGVGHINDCLDVVISKIACIDNDGTGTDQVTDCDQVVRRNIDCTCVVQCVHIDSAAGKVDCTIVVEDTASFRIVDVRCPLGDIQCTAIEVQSTVSINDCVVTVDGNVGTVIDIGNTAINNLQAFLSGIGVCQNHFAVDISCTAHVEEAGVNFAAIFKCEVTACADDGCRTGQFCTALDN